MHRNGIRITIAKCCDVEVARAKKIMVSRSGDEIVMLLEDILFIRETRLPVTELGKRLARSYKVLECSLFYED